MFAVATDRCCGVLNGHTICSDTKKQGCCLYVALGYTVNEVELWTRRAEMVEMKRRSSTVKRRHREEVWPTVLETAVLLGRVYELSCSKFKWSVSSADVRN